MFCTKCGAQVADTSKFCPKCGNPLKPVAPAASTNEAPKTEAPNPARNYGQQGQSTMRSFNAAGGAGMQGGPRQFSSAMGGMKRGSAVKEVINEFFTSPMFIILMILMAIPVIIQLTQIGRGFYVASVGGISISQFGYGGLSLLISLVPPIVILVGMIYTFVTAKNGETKTAGITAIQVILWIYFALLAFVIVYTIIQMIRALLASGVSIGNLYDAYNYGGAYYRNQITEAIIYIVIFLAIYAVIMLFFALAAKSAGAVKRTITTGKPELGISMFVIVFTIILVILSIISTAMSGFAYMSGMSIFSLLVSIMLSIIAAAFGIQYRSKMKELM